MATGDESASVLGPDEFWRWIAVLGGRADDDAVRRLTETLAGEDEAVIIGFEEQLAAHLYELDRRSLYERPYRDTKDPDGPPVGDSDDGFLYARCAVLAAGRDTFDRVRLDHAAFDQAWDLGGERILYVASAAYEQATGRPWDHETALSYETGTNPAGWPHA